MDQRTVNQLCSRVGRPLDEAPSWVVLEDGTYHQWLFAGFCFDEGVTPMLKVMDPVSRAAEKIDPRRIVSVS